VDSKARTEYKMPESFEKKKWRNVWLFRNSVFKTWHSDNDQILKECFERDWINIKAFRIILDNEDLKEV